MGLHGGERGLVAALLLLLLLLLACGLLLQPRP
jgi:hypothetical protein